MGEDMERYNSYGRGGFGNMRRPSTRIEARERLNSLSDSVPIPRRRSSVWSSHSSGEKSWKNLFRRSSSMEEPPKIEE